MTKGAAAEIALGLGIAALGAFILYETGAIKVAPVYAKVGPRDIPILVGAILALLGLLLSWQGWRAKPRPQLDPPMVMDAPGSLLDAPGTGGSGPDWMPLAVIAAGLVFQVLFFIPGDIYALIARLDVVGALTAEFLQNNRISDFLINAISGFVPTASVLFVCTSIAFGSRHFLRDILIGIGLAIVAYVGFVHVLGLSLPAGLIGSLL